MPLRTLTTRLVCLFTLCACGVADPTPAYAAATPSTQPLAKLKIVLIGDSTVNDGGGWGLGFKAHLRPEATCVNLAQNGRSSRSFVAEGWWKKALDEKPDYVLIQFGHNDQPGKGPERETDPKSTYPEQLGRYVDEARAAGAKPVIVTSLTRRLFSGGKIRSNLTEYADAAKKLGEEKKVPCIDLHAKSIELLDKIGPEEAAAFDPPPKPDAKDQRPDRTHLTRKGQEVFGKLMVDEVKKTLPELAAYFK